VLCVCHCVCVCAHMYCACVCVSVSAHGSVYICVFYCCFWHNTKTERNCTLKRQRYGNQMSKSRVKHAKTPLCAAPRVMPLQSSGDLNQHRRLTHVLCITCIVYQMYCVSHVLCITCIVYHIYCVSHLLCSA